MGGVQGPTVFGLVLRLRRINTTGCCAVTSSLFVFPHCLRCLKGGLYSSYVAQAALISHRLDLALYMASNVFPPYTHDPMAHVTALHPLVVNGGAPPGFEKAYDEVTTIRTSFRLSAGGYTRYITSDSLRTFPDNDAGEYFPLFT